MEEQYDDCFGLHLQAFIDFCQLEVYPSYYELWNKPVVSTVELSKRSTSAHNNRISCRIEHWEELLSIETTDIILL